MVTRPSDVVAARRRARRTPVGWLGAALVAVLAGGLVTAAAGAWRPGLLVVGGGLVAAAIARLALPADRLGTLAVRGPWVDGAVMLLAAGALVAASLALP